MPTRGTRTAIGQPIRRGEISERAREFTQRQAARIVRVRPPWAGYSPDLNPIVVTHAAFTQVRGLVFVGERLVSADGWFHVDDVATPLLPLGDPGNPLPSAAAQAQPIIRLDGFRKLDDTPVSEDLMAITADTTATLISGFWEADATGWAEIAYTALVAAPGAPALSESSLPDSVTAAIGAPTNSVVAEAVWVACSLEMNVMFYPDATAGTAYGDLIEIYRLGDGAGGAAVYPNNPQALKARSCEVWGPAGSERLYVLNTIEGAGATPHRQRVRRSVAGDAVDFEGVGSGARDLAEFRGEGLRLLSAGDRLFAYMEDGVAYNTATGIPSSPDRWRPLSKKRGIVGTHAVTRIGIDTHFGVFNDGFFILNSRGTWREAGIEEISGVNINRWKETFYGSLNRDEQTKVYLAYDSFRNLVVIAWPSDDSTHPNRIWRYDIAGDRVVTDDWSNVSGANMNPRCLGVVRRQLSTAPAWNATQFTGVPWSGVSGSWRSFAATFGEDAVVHGTADGYVVLHDPSIATRVGTNPTATAFTPWAIESHVTSLVSDPRLVVTADELWMHYLNGGGTNSATLELLTSGLPGDTRPLSQAQTLNLNEANANTSQSIVMRGALPGARHGFKASGLGPVVIHGFDLRYFGEPSAYEQDVGR